MITIFMSRKLCLPPIHTSAATYCHYDLPKIDSGFAAGSHACRFSEFVQTFPKLEGKFGKVGKHLHLQRDLAASYAA